MDFSSFTNNASGFILPIITYILGIVSDLIAGAINAYYSSGHITVRKKKMGPIVRSFAWIKERFQTFLERWLSNKNQHVNGTHFFYRLEMMPDGTYAWKYSQLELQINLANEIKGKNKYSSTEAKVSSPIEGNLVDDRMLILFIADQNTLYEDSSGKMVAVPDFRADEQFNLGWLVNSVEEDKHPLPAIIKKQMLNFPQQLLKDPRIKEMCAIFPEKINWTQFKNEME